MNTKHPALIGVIPAIVALLMWGANLLGVQLDEGSITETVTSVLTGISVLWGIGLMLWTAYKNRPIKADPTAIPTPAAKTVGEAPVKM